jgi:hypothetical protein
LKFSDGGIWRGTLSQRRAQRAWLYSLPQPCALRRRGAHGKPHGIGRVEIADGGLYEGESLPGCIRGKVS